MIHSRAPRGASIPYRAKPILRRAQDALAQAAEQVLAQGCAIQRRCLRWTSSGLVGPLLEVSSSGPSPTLREPSTLAVLRCLRRILRTFA
jgi:hypothetical protein